MCVGRVHERPFVEKPPEESRGAGDEQDERQAFRLAARDSAERKHAVRLLRLAAREGTKADHSSLSFRIRVGHNKIEMFGS